ncbi:hypothetical protein K3N28_04545 [Glycomyces sp. TRM65418]|uniref:hypothetical protein n=1 Tax=Glycomyces sp. TRM65418 TaxID=2867006 RepID=UPI001CE50DD3|nr:hypothetical protein [Glycomyces sp. TRM65418]MCC3762335.1 hypothetical protein [Glycomyces sp. TRM65418]QZD56387.1 hypothetical protein K3N28_04510 [Glycomyces sp. TRM65418]
MPDPSPEQPPSWPPTSEPAATPTNPPRITARGVGHLPSTAPEDEPSATDRAQRPPTGGVYGEPAQQSGPYEELDPDSRPSEWGGAFGDPTPGVPQQPGPQQPQSTPDAGPGSAPNANYEAPAQQNEWGEAPDWPPKSSQDWMAQQSQTGWGLTNGGAAWPGPSPVPPAESAPQTPADQSFPPESGSAPYGSPTPGTAFAPPPQDTPQQAGQEASGGSLEFPELRADPYEADVYGHAQYRGEAGGQDLYQSDPYQADRLQAEAERARQEYQAQQQSGPFPPAPQQDPYGEAPAGRQGAPGAYGTGADAYAAEQPYQPEAQADPYFGGQQSPEAPQNPYFPDQPSYEDQSRGEQPFGEAPFADHGYQAQQGQQAQQAFQSQPGQAFQDPASADQAFQEQGVQDPAHQDQAGHRGQAFQDSSVQVTGGDTLPSEAVPAQRSGEESAALEAPARPESRDARVSPPTHVGVRYAIYGIGGLITLGLIIGIVIMLGATPPEEPGQQGQNSEGDTSNESPAADDALTPERYAELAAAAGTAEWFSWRYGDAGENSAEELPQASGDAVATEPLLDGAADRSIQGQLGYVTDESGLSGIDHVTAVETTDTLLGIAPRAGGKFTEDGAPELELQEGATADCLAGLGVELGEPVALARPEQSEEVNAHSVIAFSSGVIATAGISGAQGGTCLQLPAGQVPTDVALTDGNELALVTTWTPESQTGSLVVIALGDKSGSYQSSWSESYPGLPNPGHFAAAEILGTVELPFSAPTSVDAWSDSGGSLADQRGTVEDGAGRDNVAGAGYAIVGDLDASQVAVVDLASTFQGLAARHYDGAEFAFDATAGEAVAFDGGVADVAATEGASAVATGDGVVHELDGELKETAATQVGANPTCLVVGTQSGAFIATSRGEAKISWVSGGAIAKELADSRMTDPICASETPALDAKGYDGTAAVVLVADYEGQRLHGYLDGEASIPGGATVGGDGFTYGGAYEVAGKPWGVSVTVDLE